MIQPILDRHCADCHGGAHGFAGGMDLTGGWTEHFNISYENLTTRRETQLVAYWIAGIDCMNGTALWSAQIFPPRFHGSGAAPLAQLLVDGHEDRIPNLTRRERDLLMAWIDSNGLYYGTWNHSPSGCAIQNWANMRNSLIGEMRAAGCLECHGAQGKPYFFEEDWVNLQQPRWSRLLRAPMAKDADGGLGQALCRKRPVEPDSQRIRLLCNGYAHAVQPPEQFPHRSFVKRDHSGEAVVSFDNETDRHYQAMLSIIREARAQALASPRVDMPGAEVMAGASRLFVQPPVPDRSPPLSATILADGTVQLQWGTSWNTIGLTTELHRSDLPGFSPDDNTLLVSGQLSEYADHRAPTGQQHYQLIIKDKASASQPTRVSVKVPAPTVPPSPTGLKVVSTINSIQLAWQEVGWPFVGYRVYRRGSREAGWSLVSGDVPVRPARFVDTTAEPNQPYEYTIRSVSVRGLESSNSTSVTARNEVILEPVFSTHFQQQPTAALWPDKLAHGQLVKPAKCSNHQLDLRSGGHVTFPHHAHFDLKQPLTLECWIYVDQESQMPVYVSCGAWKQTGWFLQRLGNSWRWHAGGVDCDGGTPVTSRWTHLTAIAFGNQLRLFQDGKLVAEVEGAVNRGVWSGPLHIGQYGGQPGPAYQALGRVAAVRLYHRALGDDEIRRLASTPPKP
jgi:hypothetical protein